MSEADEFTTGTAASSDRGRRARAERPSFEFWWLSIVALVLAARTYTALRLHILPSALERALAFLEKFSLGVGAER